MELQKNTLSPTFNLRVRDDVSSMTYFETLKNNPIDVFLDQLTKRHIYCLRLCLAMM
jgi:hypothetical protein